ncbi:hypothetical protein B0H34DRAFT_296399 [Crassisporium funariophilum]|nr:hypothetical protein B0H34DRAFT_296399 [Crassisporium funariophilum]
MEATPRRSTRLTKVSQNSTSAVLNINPAGTRKRSRQASAQREPAEHPQNERVQECQKVIVSENQAYKGKSKVAAEMTVLDYLLSMPIDIALEIFGLLEPLSILHLARTTKPLRRLLMSRSSITIWKRAKEAYPGIPKCPEGMSEPQYAYLAFDMTCHGCGQINATTTFWSAGLRACFTCRRTMWASDVIVPSFTNLKKSLKQIPSLKSAADLRKLHCYRNLPPIVKAHLRRIVQHPGCSMSQARLWSMEFEKLRDAQSRATWSQQFKSRMAALDEHQIKFENWLDLRRSQRAANIARVQQHIKEGFMDKLIDLGWGKELELLKRNTCPLYTYFTEIRFSNIQAETFHEAWAAYKPILVQYLMDQRTLRLSRERREEVQSRYKYLQAELDDCRSTLSPDVVIPDISAIAAFPLVKTMLEAVTTDIPLTAETSENHSLSRIIPNVLTEWRLETDNKLLKLLQEVHPTSTKYQLPLATTMFCCIRCNQRTIPYPRVLTHACAFLPIRHADGWPIYCQPADRLPWNADACIKFSSNASKAAIDVVNLLNLDPAVATAREMDDMKCMLQCMTCKETPSGRMSMEWSRAVSHSLLTHTCQPSAISWNIPGPQGRSMLHEQLTVEEITEERQSMRSPSYMPRFMCAHCEKRDFHFRLKEHLSTAHDIETTSKGDIIVHPDADPLLPCCLPEIE